MCRIPVLSASTPSSGRRVNLRPSESTLENKSNIYRKASKQETTESELKKRNKHKPQMNLPGINLPGNVGGKGSVCSIITELTEPVMKNPKNNISVPVTRMPQRITQSSVGFRGMVFGFPLIRHRPVGPFMSGIKEHFRKLKKTRAEDEIMKRVQSQSLDQRKRTRTDEDTIRVT